MGGTLVIVPCGGQKVWGKEPGRGAVEARDVYTSGFFKINRTYAERFGDGWLILSAKYGFILPSFLIPGPYDVTFKQRSTGPITVRTLRQQVQDLRLDDWETIIGLGGKDYRNIIQAAFSGASCEVVFPFSGLAGMGYIMRAVKQATELG